MPNVHLLFLGKINRKKGVNAGVNDGVCVGVCIGASAGFVTQHTLQSTDIIIHVYKYME